MSVIQYNPATGEKVCEVPLTDPDSYSDMFVAARKAQILWREFSYKKRIKHVQKIREYLFKNGERIVRGISASCGKTMFEAKMQEVQPCLMGMKWYMDNVEDILGDKKISPASLLFVNKVSYRIQKPLGVVGIISPWNYPFAIPFSEIIMALLAGNAVILKVATASVHVGELIEEVITHGNLPEGLFTHLVCPGTRTSKILFDNKIDKLFFTGSVPVGKILMREAAETLTPIVLELGGNDPAIVLEDADIERTTNGIIWGAFQNTGQTCAGIERCYVHEKIYDKFVDVVCRKVKLMKHGVPDENFSVDFGSMTTKGQYEKVLEHIEDAVKKGAIVAAQSRPVGNVENGYFIPATVLTCVNHDMETMKDETFGPVLPIFKVSSVEEAVRHANNSQYTLTASIWSNNNSNSRKIARLLNAGVVTINDHVYTHGSANCEWGGWKDSGIGRTHGEGGLKEMCNPVVVDYDWFPRWMARRNIWWYDFDKETYKAFERASAYSYHESLILKIWFFLLILPLMMKKMIGHWDRRDKDKKDE